ncbi:MAG: polysaccharide deacetylase family protein [Verrucomicrobia bacterium]|nr:polysaccharide deacetylase family protein [Verrucomicrobiota bacterium]
MVKSGHSIGNHTSNHPKFTFWRLVPSKLAEEIDSFEQTIRALDLPVPIFFRAPAGLTRSFTRFWLHEVCTWSAGVHELTMRSLRILTKSLIG